jgi:hypothetical protein
MRSSFNLNISITAHLINTGVLQTDVGLLLVHKITFDHMRRTREQYFDLNNFITALPLCTGVLVMDLVLLLVHQTHLVTCAERVRSSLNLNLAYI